MKTFVVVVAITIGVLLPVAAAAQDDDPYPTPSSTPTVTEPATPAGTGTEVPDSSDGGWELPVTGGQLAALTVLGLAALGAGAMIVVVTRRGRRAHPA